MRNLPKSLEPDPLLETTLGGSRRDPDITIESRRSLHPEFVFSHGTNGGIFYLLHATLLRPPNIYCTTTNRRPVWSLQCQKHPSGGSMTMLVASRIVRLKTVLARTGLSRSTIYRKIAEGTFPAQLKISMNGSGWHESDIDRWIANPAGWRPPEALTERMRANHV
jgi:prophage regulatory protein